MEERSKFNEVRTANFRARLEIEREVLGVVNSTKMLPELPGLTADAIEAWEARAKVCGTDFDISIIASTLRVIARVTGTITDNSRAVLSDHPIGQKRELIIKLSALVRSV